MAADFEPPVAFYFTVRIGDAGADSEAAAFQEASGLEMEMQVEPVQEGGENWFVHQLPKGVKHKNLVLKRGVTDASNDLISWCEDTLEFGLSKQIETKSVTVSLLDKEGNPLATWSLSNAWPVKYSVGALDAMKNQIAVETIELAYNEMWRY